MLREAVVPKLRWRGTRQGYGWWLGRVAVPGPHLLRAEDWSGLVGGVSV